LPFHLKTVVIQPPKRCGMFDMRGYTMSKMSFAIMKYVSDQIQKKMQRKYRPNSSKGTGRFVFGRLMFESRTKHQVSCAFFREG
jgi:hypothetical protein